MQPVLEEKTALEPINFDLSKSTVVISFPIINDLFRKGTYDPALANEIRV